MERATKGVPCRLRTPYATKRDDPASSQSVQRRKPRAAAELKRSDALSLARRFAWQKGRIMSARPSSSRSVLFVFVCVGITTLLSGSVGAAPAAGPPPPMAGALPALPGSAWKIDFGRGVTGTAFLFCSKARGRWEIVPANGKIGAVGKSYAVSGNTLTTVNADDGLVEKWRMTWKDGVLELFDGKTTLKLHYNGTTAC